MRRSSWYALLLVAIIGWGIAGLIAFFGYDGFMFSVGWLVAYLTVLLVVAEPLRNAGKYTMADVLAYRLKVGRRDHQDVAGFRQPPEKEIALVVGGDDVDGHAIAGFELDDDLPDIPAHRIAHFAPDRIPLWPRAHAHRQADRGGQRAETIADHNGSLSRCGGSSQPEKNLDRAKGGHGESGAWRAKIAATRR